MKINKIFIFMQIAFVLLLSGCSKKEQDDSFVLDLPGETKESIQTGELAGKLECRKASILRWNSMHRM